MLNALAPNYLQARSTVLAEQAGSPRGGRFCFERPCVEEPRAGLAWDVAAGNGAAQVASWSGAGPNEPEDQLLSPVANAPKLPSNGGGVGGGIDGGGVQCGGDSCNTSIGRSTSSGGNTSAGGSGVNAHGSSRGGGSTSSGGGNTSSGRADEITPPQCSLVTRKEPELLLDVVGLLSGREPAQVQWCCSVTADNLHLVTSKDNMS